jgi:hypothetical protein
MGMLAGRVDAPVWSSPESASTPKWAVLSKSDSLPCFGFAWKR